MTLFKGLEDNDGILSYGIFSYAFMSVNTNLKTIWKSLR